MYEQGLFSLTGKRVLITGSSRGLGLVLAKGMAEVGAEIILNGRDTDALGAAAKSLADNGAKVSALAFDVTSPDSIEQAIDHAETQIGPIDVLINNAGILRRGPLEDIANEDFDHIMTANVSSVYYVTHTVIPHMIARRSGKIINMSSISAATGRPSNAPYGVSKAAITSLTYNMAAEWGHHGITANAIAPGFIAGGMNTDNVKNAKYSEWVIANTPMRRWGQPEELIGAAVFLASSASQFVNGHVLAVDGGAATSML